MSPRLLVLTAALLLPPSALAQPDDLAAKTRIASGEMRAGRFEEAARIYRELLKARPDEPGLLTNLGMALAMAGREADALAPLQRALALEPGLLPAQLFLGSSYLALDQPAKAVPLLERVVAAQPKELEHRRMLADAYMAAGRTMDAVGQWRRVTEIAPKEPHGWYALGHAYNAVTQEALASFEADTPGSPWQQLLLADALLADGRMTDAFAAYRAVLDDLPHMVSVHDSVARIYEQTGHKEWAAEERSRGALPEAACQKRKALCAFRAGRHRDALAAALEQDDPESRYWRARAATELALRAFKQLDALPDSRERREVRASLARDQRRYVDAIEELKVALKFAPGDPGLIDDLGTSYYLARDYERAAETLAPLAKRGGDPRVLTMYGDALAQLQRVDEALPLLKRAVEMAPAAPEPRLTLGRAYIQKGDHAAAIPMIEPALETDRDGSLHVQLARAYAATGQKERADVLLKRAQELQQAAREREAALADRTIAPPAPVKK